jgi:membrane associated rhomboid family serine protease
MIMLTVLNAMSQNESGTDNCGHLGGFVTGLCLSVFVLRGENLTE